MRTNGEIEHDAKLLHQLTRIADALDSIADNLTLLATCYVKEGKDDE